MVKNILSHLIKIAHLIFYYESYLIIILLKMIGMQKGCVVTNK